MKTRTKSEKCAVCFVRAIHRRLPVCAVCWRSVPSVESIAYFAAIDSAITTADPAKTIRRARARVVFVLRGG